MPIALMAGVHLLAHFTSHTKARAAFCHSSREEDYGKNASHLDQAIYMNYMK